MPAGTASSVRCCAEDRIDLQKIADHPASRIPIAG
jgi:hypothetical protein